MTTNKKIIKEERKRRGAIEILKLAGCIDDIDDDVSDMCFKVMPKGEDKLISMSEFFEGVQNIKNKIIAQKNKQITDIRRRLKNCAESNKRLIEQAKRK